MMRYLKYGRFICLCVFLIALAGCNLPMNQTATPYVFPTPNQTLTALFQAPEIIPPTITPSAGQAEITTIPTQAKTVAPSPTVTMIMPSATAAASTATQTTAAAATTATKTTAAATATATKTSAAATATTAGSNGSKHRVSPAATAAFLSTAVTIDGKWDDWAGVPESPITSVVWGAKNWTNTADSSATYQIAWDNTYLYLAVKVTDDKFVQSATGKYMYQGDSAEILVDTDVAGDFASTSLSGDDFQLGFSPGTPAGTNTEAYLWFPESKAGKPVGVKVAAAAESATVWRLEAAVPWSTLGITPTSGMHLGFAVSVSDNDNSSKADQQSMISNTPSRKLIDPTTWGDLTLQK